jgi:hypothetical protein
MWCRVLNALKFENDGTRREPGAVVDIPEEIFATLPEGTVELTDAPEPDLPPASSGAEAPEAPVIEVIAEVLPQEPAAAVEAVQVEEPPVPTVDTTAPVAEEPSAPVSTG